MTTENIDYYIVKPGDTLATIIAKTGVSRATLVKCNHQETIKKLNAGDVLYLNQQTAFSVQVLFLDALRHPIENLVYRIEVDYKKITGKTPKNGLLDEFITLNAQSKIQIYIKDLQGNWQQITSSVSDYGKKLITAVSPYLVFKDKLQPHPPRAPTTPEPPKTQPAPVPKGKQPPLPAPPSGEPTPNNAHVKKRKGKGKHGESVIHLGVDLPEGFLQLFTHYNPLAITKEDWNDTAKNLACEVNVLKAIAQVESAGAAFWRTNLNDGAYIPQILFERMHFSTFTHGQYDKDYPDISGPRRSAGTFGNNQMQYLRLINAYRLDKNAALKSCSWGKFQILGENYGLCREHDVVSFVTKMATNEAKQLELFAVFIRNKMDRKNKREAYGTLLWHAVQQKDWENIARYYNGPKYKKYNYDTKLYQTYENMDKEG